MFSHVFVRLQNNTRKILIDFREIRGIGRLLIREDWLNFGNDQKHILDSVFYHIYR